MKVIVCPVRQNEAVFDENDKLCGCFTQGIDYSGLRKAFLAHDEAHPPVKIEVGECPGVGR